jgi:fatty acid-binding protein DegV
MDLNAANTAVVLDSTADYPEGPTRHPNWRVVPLYVRFGDESFRDYVELGPREFYGIRADPFRCTCP